ncbi:hypothetical protein [Cellulosilyticum sp. I15G10I2]|uniref:hypothetical protein n=1 Tax=Cellulosilyticum sp. I15G10I2 TaxID=1892843 RepID=UPI00085C084E|nr:hypothetical protein [Cellulosilyticum sp. I15G10I2]
MKIKFPKIHIVLLSGLLLFGCAPRDTEPIPPINQDNNAAGIILEGADQAKNINVEDVESVTLYDLEDNIVEKDLDKQDIVKAFNDSMIDDTSYITMITGYKMVISLRNNTEIQIISYGDDSRVVASTETMSYHLISPDLAKILLEN